MQKLFVPQKTINESIYLGRKFRIVYSKYKLFDCINSNLINEITYNENSRYSCKTIKYQTT